MKPRMGYLVSQYPAVGHTFILREIRGLRSQGFDLLVISVKPGDHAPQQLGPEEREEQSRTRVIRTTSPLRRAAIHARVFAERPWGYLRGLADALRMAGWSPRRLAAHLRYFGEAVVAGRWFQRAGHTHLHSHFSSTVAVLARQVFGFNLSLTLHGSDEFIDPAGFRLAEKVAAASLVCVISQFGRSQVMRFSDPKDWHKIVVLPLGVDPAMFSPAPFRAAPEVFEIAFVGQLAPVKGCFILLDAVERLVRGGRKLRLRFAGGGPLRGALAAEIEKRGLSAQARLEGPLNPPAVVALYRETDIFALASFAEGVPVVLMEAMAMQIPCVATRITGIPELIRDGLDGLLVTASSAEEMAAAIARLMDDPDLRQRLGESARRQVMERHDLNRNTAAQAEVFRRYLAGL